jgi:hypothetical protein
VLYLHLFTGPDDDAFAPANLKEVVFGVWTKRPDGPSS